MIDILVGDPLPRSADRPGRGVHSGTGSGTGRAAQEEPQSERGPKGSRDRGGPPGAGPADRPAGTSDTDDSTAIDPQEPIAVADLDLDAGAVIAQAQLDGSAAVDHGIGHQLAREQDDEIEQLGGPRRRSGDNEPASQPRRCTAARSRRRPPSARPERRTRAPAGEAPILDCHVDLADSTTSGPADGVVSGSGSSVRTRPNRTSDFAADRSRIRSLRGDAWAL